MSKILLALLTVTASTAWSAESTMNSLERQDAVFVENATLGGLLEVRASEMAIKRGVSGDDKAFAMMMVTDHTKANQELMALAKRKNVTLPTELDAKHQEQLDLIGKTNDRDLGERYLEGQVAAHKAAVDLFTTQADKGTDPELKAFAAATLPTLKSHLERAKKLEDKH